MKTSQPEGLIGSMFEIHDKFDGRLRQGFHRTMSSTWIVVEVWKGDGRGRRGRKGMWRVTLAPIEGAGNRPMFNALWNDVGKFLEAWDENGNRMMTKQVK
jgi:hypothetical protein